ncbi:MULTISPECIES: acyltransferase family protein [unclassified Pseudoclavibacter]|uniref:acyltransferase family protein n=1 Tax=unclassified Pseudoclavibacter TaxID=2615177 RepID=UPI001BA8725E|nr:acyltransferase [Pseudoclavibacter sp. Marseille-Q4354]MBS3180158.1 acyltransferase [Pseudoclavibacter sp. Marseille-Q4354]
MSDSLRGALATRNNSLNFVRLCLAAAVILGHSWLVGGFDDSPFPKLGWWAVNGFFAISGYLIAGSRLRTRFLAFIWRRALRILPAFWVCLIVTAAVVAPVSTLLSGETPDVASAFSYVLRNFALSVQQTGIDGTLDTVPAQGIWNGSLWTLAYEFGAYLFAGAVLTIAVVRRRTAWVLGAMLVGVSLIYPFVMRVLDNDNLVIENILRLIGFFLAGMFLYVVGDRISLKTGPFLVSVTVFVALALFGLDDYFGQVPLAHALLWLGARMRVPLGRENDISYGLYIWAWPVQQLLVLAGAQALGPWVSALLALVCTLPLAWLSWKGVEEPAMRLRHLVPVRDTSKNPSPSSASTPQSPSSADDPRS